MRHDGMTQRRGATASPQGSVNLARASCPSMGPNLPGGHLPDQEGTAHWPLNWYPAGNSGTTDAQTPGIIPIKPPAPTPGMGVKRRLWLTVRPPGAPKRRPHHPWCQHGSLAA